MANKTQETTENVMTFINSISDETQKEDCIKLLQMMKEATGNEPKMWGPSIVGYGNYRYKYESGREGDWFSLGFSPRKGKTTIYFSGTMEKVSNKLKELGKYKVGGGCLYIKKFSDINESVLKEMLEIAQKEFLTRNK